MFFSCTTPLLDQPALRSGKYDYRKSVQSLRWGNPPIIGTSYFEVVRSIICTGFFFGLGSTHHTVPPLTSNMLLRSTCIAPLPRPHSQWLRPRARFIATTFCCTTWCSARKHGNNNNDDTDLRRSSPWCPCPQPATQKTVSPITRRFTTTSSPTEDLMTSEWSIVVNYCPGTAVHQGEGGFDYVPPLKKSP